MQLTIEMMKLKTQTEQAIEDVDGTDSRRRQSKLRKTQMEQTTHQSTTNADGTNSRRRRSEPRKMQMEQTTHQGIVDADRANKAPDNTKEAQTANVDKTSHG